MDAIPLLFLVVVFGFFVTVTIVRGIRHLFTRPGGLDSISDRQLAATGTLAASTCVIAGFVAFRGEFTGNVVSELAGLIAGAFGIGWFLQEADLRRRRAAWSSVASKARSQIWFSAEYFLRSVAKEVLSAEALRSIQATSNDFEIKTRLGAAEVLSTVRTRDSAAEVNPATVRYLELALRRWAPRLFALDLSEPTVTAELAELFQLESAVALLLDAAHHSSTAIEEVLLAVTPYLVKYDSQGREFLDIASASGGRLAPSEAERWLKEAARHRALQIASRSREGD